MKKFYSFFLSVLLILPSIVSFAHHIFEEHKACTEVDVHFHKAENECSICFVLNNTENNIDFYLEDKLHESEYINFHPLTNKATVTINSSKFIKFMIENKKKIHIFSSSSEKIVRTYE